jgi:hypothetical protein
MLVVLDPRRDIGVVSDVSLGVVDAEHHAELRRGNREPVGGRNPNGATGGHINRERAVWAVFQPWRISSDHVLTRSVRD